MLLAAPVYAEEIPTPAAGAGTSVTQTAPESQQETSLAPYLGKTITKQIIAGNKTVPEAEIAAALKTKPGMQFTEAGLSEDLSAIYDMGWFYDLRPEFKLVPEGVQVIYHVMENPVYQKTEVEGNTVLNKQKVAGFFDLEQGKIANLKDINKCVQKLEEEYRSNGYILARVTDVHMEPDGTLKVTANEGIVEGFKVKGNVKTKDYVVTREMKLKKGEPFNAKAARRSMQRVYNLGYFEDVNIKLNPGREPNGVEVEISVVEMNTGTFGIGAGYSNADGFVGMVSIGDKNFRGIGDKINLRWEFGGMGGDFDFTKWTADWRYYYRAGGESVWALNLGVGYASGDMPLSQRFTMGGSDTLRGYEDDQFRGNSMLKATLEYRFPIVKKVQGVLFTDNGYAWDKRHEDEFDMGLLKNSYGVGLRINSPLGPVKLDYGYGEDGGKFHFSFGGQF